MSDYSWKNKLVSGRFVWCLFGAYVFLYCAIMEILPPADVKMVLGIIVTFYFTKSREKE